MAKPVPAAPRKRSIVLVAGYALDAEVRSELEAHDVLVLDIGRRSIPLTLRHLRAALVLSRRRSNGGTSEE